MLDKLKREIELNGVELETVVMMLVYLFMVGMIIFKLINTLQFLNSML